MRIRRIIGDVSAHSGCGVIPMVVVSNRTNVLVNVLVNMKNSSVLSAQRKHVARSSTVLVDVQSQNQFVTWFAHEMENANSIARHHHHQTVVEIWNVGVKMDMHDTTITQAIQDVFQRTNVHRVTVVNTNIGMSVDQPVMKISAVQCGDHSVLNLDAVHHHVTVVVNPDANVTRVIFATEVAAFCPRNVTTTTPNVRLVNISVNVQTFVRNFIAVQILVAISHWKISVTIL